MTPTFRPFNPKKDSTSYVTCLNSIAAHKGEPQDFTEAAQREQAEALREAGISTHCTVAEVDGAIIGFADLWKIPATPHAPLTVGVHPKWRGQGVGEQLLKRARQQARGFGVTALLAYAQPSDDTARAFFTENGFVAVSGYRKMSVTLTKVPEAPRWSKLNVLTYAQVDQPYIYTEASSRGWGDLWGHTTPTEETTAAALDMYAPEGIFLLFSGEEIVGICKANEIDLGSDGAFSGEVDAPGIAPEHRSEDNYRNLSLEALRWLYERGHRHVTLESWGEPNIALAAYESLGFTLDEHELGYALSLMPK